MNKKNNDGKLSSMKKEIRDTNTQSSEHRNKDNKRKSAVSFKSALSSKYDDIVEDNTTEKEISEKCNILSSKKLDNVEKLSSKKKERRDNNTYSLESITKPKSRKSTLSSRSALSSISTV